MAPRTEIDFVILRMTFLPYIHPTNPRISFTSKKHSPSATLIQVRDWFDRIISSEKSQFPPHIKTHYSEWRIMSGNANLFTIDGCRFDRVLLILGDEKIYWLFYQNMPMHRRIEGSSSIQLPYCSCCLNNHYVKIMEAVKQSHDKR